MKVRLKSRISCENDAHCFFRDGHIRSVLTTFQTNPSISLANAEVCF